MLIAERPDETIIVSPFCKSLKPLVSHAYLVLRLYHATVDMVKDDIHRFEAFPVTSCFNSLTIYTFEC